MRIAQINPGHMNIPPDSWGAVEKIIWYYKLELEKLGHEVSIKYINEINQNDFDIVHVHMWNHAIGTDWKEKVSIETIEALFRRL